MKKLLYFIFIFSVLLMSWDIQKQEMAIAAPQESATIPDQAIRLRIIANSDSPEDQWLKRKIRDEIVAQLDPYATKVKTIEEARAVIKEHLPAFQELVEKTIKDNGFSYSEPPKVELGIVPFPTKMYGQTVYPAGEYEALRITLGAGKGQNWWCVLFPPLCFVDISTGDAVDVVKNTTVDKTQQSIVQLNDPEEVEVRFFLFDMLLKLFSFIKSIF
ncbi:stage II sporulation protein R [Tepidibacillus decaturensis]|uniref:Stage II sporulation protein R n=1 Tax=Tepidibacillus decaturensis TaxID=1413211 RepID=A0A135L6R6_9BACI|nr:stage II sporulation protein R [Tepidibacillus decaturensis]KXG44666.1 hypothetical protein U473_12020 [Tepidibacillus decaturensis]